MHAKHDAYLDEGLNKIRTRVLLRKECSYRTLILCPSYCDTGVLKETVFAFNLCDAGKLIFAVNLGLQFLIMLFNENGRQYGIK